MRSFDLNLLSSLINLTVASISASSPADSGSGHFSAKHGCDLGALIRGCVDLDVLRKIVGLDCNSGPTGIHQRINSRGADGATASAAHRIH
jgi:hypothetical protein